ncbi:hypothetical protein OQY15_20125 [Pedobacter sp. MC2016-15]|uniref:MutS-related protein n=1 Tax=Pedobacter sp. MC2016-15 TaxID=2994473 RepID=UPI0022452D0A|nr:hypothetical protein [Pedobacter sp. MC2016-15]MCX2481417.1 hypothetical protein [Pedobacter sp. MC2016-15]
MLIAFYIILTLLIIYVLVYFYKKLAEKTNRERLRQDWGQPKNSRYIDLDSVENYFLNTISDSAEKLQLISDKVANDLYLNEVFKLVDRTVSRVGQQFLYARLRTLDKNTDALMVQDAFAELMADDEELRLNTQVILQKLEKNDSYYFQDLVYAKKIDRPEFMPLIYLLTFLNIACLLAGFFYPTAFLVFGGVFIINSGIHYWNKNNVSVHTSSLGEFLKAFDTAKSLDAEPKISTHFPDTGLLIRELTPLKRKMIGVKLDNMAEGDAAIVGFLVFELLKIAFNIEIISFYSIIDSLREKKEKLKDLFKFIGTVDTAISVAAFRSSLDHYCKPVFNSTIGLEVLAVRHPLIADCVPNDLHLEQKNLLLTGSNMSGKTTFIRSVGINMILGQTLLTCLADKFVMPYSKIFSSITISDSLLEEKSYYFEEMRIIKEFIQESRNEAPSFFILDEIFKGTNTIERVSAGKAILSYLAKNNNLVFVSTHDTELNELLKSEYDLYHFTETVAEEELLFDHKIKKGPLKTRNAIKILEINDYPAAIINDANATVDLLMRD